MVGMVSSGLRRPFAASLAWAARKPDELELLMLARFLAGSLVAASVAFPVLAEDMGPEQARQFVANKMFSFTCFDGSRGSGRIYSDGSVAGSIQFGGTGPMRYARLPVN